MAPGTKPPAIVCFAVSLLGRLFPRKRLTLPELNRTFDSAFGSADWAAAARADPLVSCDSFYLGPSSQVFGAARALRRRAGAVRVPLLVMQSKTDTRTSAAAAERFYADASSADKTLLLYDDGSHQLFQDTQANTARAIGDLRAWLDARYRPSQGEC
jgi:alpha-beta hydrolase superfamily lysophospholipase